VGRALGGNPASLTIVRRRGTLADAVVTPSATLAEIVSAEDPETVAGVVDRLRALDAALDSADGVSWFIKLYLEVTEAVGSAIVPGAFRDPAFLARLDVTFANLFVAALRQATRDPADTPKAWAPLIEARAARGIAPIQFALAGMNAHINRDLPIALMSACEAAGVDLEHAAPERADFERVNALLEAAEARVKSWFATGFIGVVDVALAEVDDRIAMWNVARARDAAWVQAQSLWALRSVPDLQAALLDTLDHVVGFAGRGLLVPAA
jgi:hypothetical protein